jgi:hypothetical protein
MNATLISPGSKVLTDVATRSSVTDESSPEHRKYPKPTELYTVEEIHARAEMMTPLLKGILDFHPAPHWGINE